MATLSFAGHAKGGVEPVSVDIDQLVIAPDYRSAPLERLTQKVRLDVSQASVPAHVVLIGAAERLWVTVGADHADALAIARTAWRFEEVEPHWDRLTLGGVALATMRAPRDLIAGWKGSKRLPVGVALFCDALPSLDIELADPVLGRTIKHSS